MVSGKSTGWILYSLFYYIMKVTGPFCRKGGSTQAKKLEITYEELQKQLGLGVTPHHV